MLKSLEEINASAYEYQLAVEHKVKTICEPLKNLGILSFLHHRIFNDGLYSMVTDNSNFAKIYLSSVEHMGSIVTEQCNKSIENITHCFFYPNDIRLYDEKTNNIMHVLYETSFWNILSIYKLNKSDGLDVYSFSVSISSSDNASQFYLNNIPLLERFIDYYNHKAIDLIIRKDKKSFGHFNQTFNFGQNDLTHETREGVKQFLQATQYDIRYIQYKSNDISLSPRQTECLKYLSEGYSMKQIAAMLNISSRTIECYLSSIKTKTGCRSTKALITSYAKSF